MTAVRGATTASLPIGFGVVFDTTAVEVEPGVFSGGRPWRVLRVTAAGRAALEELRAGTVATRGGGVLARRFVDAGLLHPSPPATAPVDPMTVVIPVYERVESLRRCLAALGREHPVIVVDDGSADAVAIRAVSEAAGARVIRHDRNRGPAAARNAGLRAARTPLVAFADSDTRPTAAALTALARHLLDERVTAAAPRIAPHSDESWTGRYTRVRCPLDLGGAPAAVRPYGAVSYLPSAVLIARRHEVLRVGGFAEDLRVGEDVDLVWRLRAAGGRLRYAPEVEVPHDEPHGPAALLGRRFRYGTSTAVLSRRHPDHVAPLIVRPAFVATAVAVLTSRPLIAAAAGLTAHRQVRRALDRARLPRTRLRHATANGVWQTYLGLGRYGTQFAAPLLLTALVSGSGRRRAAAAALALGPIVTAWRATDRSLDLPRFAVAALADDIAYGTGVLAGCRSQRTLRPLRPRLARAESLS